MWFNSDLPNKKNSPLSGNLCEPLQGHIFSFQRLGGMAKGKRSGHRGSFPLTKHVPFNMPSHVLSLERAECSLGLFPYTREALPSTVFYCFLKLRWLRRLLLLSFQFYLRNCLLKCLTSMVSCKETRSRESFTVC